MCMYQTLHTFPGIKLHFHKQYHRRATKNRFKVSIRFNTQSLDMSPVLREAPSIVARNVRSIWLPLMDMRVCICCDWIFFSSPHRQKSSNYTSSEMRSLMCCTCKKKTYQMSVMCLCVQWRHFWGGEGLTEREGGWFGPSLWCWKFGVTLNRNIELLYIYLYSYNLWLYRGETENRIVWSFRSSDNVFAVAAVLYQNWNLTIYRIIH